MDAFCWQEVDTVETHQSNAIEKRSNYLSTGQGICLHPILPLTSSTSPFVPEICYLTLNVISFGLLGFV
jgi:hypothetical protein